MDEALVLNWETGLYLWEMVAKAGRAKSRERHRTCFISHLIPDNGRVPTRCQLTCGVQTNFALQVGSKDVSEQDTTREPLVVCEDEELRPSATGRS